jgi:hypothetical protein
MLGSTDRVRRHLFSGSACCVHVARVCCGRLGDFSAAKRYHRRVAEQLAHVRAGRVQHPARMQQRTLAAGRLIAFDRRVSADDLAGRPAAGSLRIESWSGPSSRRRGGEGSRRGDSDFSTTATASRASQACSHNLKFNWSIPPVIVAVKIRSQK